MFGFIICLFLVCLTVCIVVNCNSSSSIKEVSKAIDQYNSKAININDFHDGIRKQIEQGDCSEEHRKKIQFMLGNYINGFNALVEEQSRIVTLYEKAQKSINSHRMAQNLFLGGANDISALFYYSKESQYNKISKMEKLTDPKQMLFWAKVYINDPTQFAKMRNYV